MRYQRDKDLVEIAVLVGDYPTVDDPEAQTRSEEVEICRAQVAGR